MFAALFGSPAKLANPRELHPLECFLRPFAPSTPGWPVVYRRRNDGRVQPWEPVTLAYAPARVCTVVDGLFAASRARSGKIHRAKCIFNTWRGFRAPLFIYQDPSARASLARPLTHSLTRLRARSLEFNVTSRTEGIRDSRRESRLLDRAISFGLGKGVPRCGFMVSVVDRRSSRKVRGVEQGDSGRRGQSRGYSSIYTRWSSVLVATWANKITWN